ncbi:MAG: purine-nucleoside phosphorylase [Christensenellaceae bacterium]|jgi:phosphoglucomutase|nr:purine-nucleoside phosphorylase [Christensenellaceae bacterium]
MNETILRSYDFWKRNIQNKEDWDILRNMTEKQIEGAFDGSLSFGTAGIRGEMGLGPNRINLYNIARVTNAYVKLLKETDAKSVIIGYDNRLNSDIFAKACACIFASNNIKVYFFNDITATPVISFGVRHLGLGGGVMITSSHNPKQFNGYKLYNNKGSQLNSDDAKKVAEFMEAVPFDFAYEYDFDSFVKQGMIIYDTEVVESFLKKIISLQLHPIENISICYTALNGCGYKIVPELFNRVTKNCQFVKVEKQCKKDSSFSSCPSPNPEHLDALTLGIRTAEQHKCDVLLATDPDADRLGIVVRHKDKYIKLNGNDTGTLIFNFLLTQLKAKKKLPKNPIIIKSIVTTTFIDIMAKQNDVRVFNGVTGFPSLGGIMNTLAEKGEEKNIILCFEESIGFMEGTYARDKGGIGAARMIAEMVSFYKSQHKTLIDVLDDLQVIYGFYKNYSVTHKLEGEKGKKHIDSLMKHFRTDNIKTIRGLEVTQKIDYLDGIGDIPKVNVLEFKLGKNSRVLMRPSGTEPLMKLYFNIFDPEDNEIYKQNMSVSTPHILALEGDIAEVVLMPGDPLRAKYISDNFLEDAIEINTVRNMLGFTGIHKGKRVTVFGSGMGIPSMGIYSYELFKFYGVKSIIRMGTTGMIARMNLGDIIVAEETFTNSSFPKDVGYTGPLVADKKLLSIAVNLAKEKNKPIISGKIFTSEAFYEADMAASIKRYQELGILSIEMETAALYANAKILGKRALSILSISDDVLNHTNSQTPDERQKSNASIIELALDTLIKSLDD